MGDDAPLFQIPQIIINTPIEVEELIGTYNNTGKPCDQSTSDKLKEKLKRRLVLKKQTPNLNHEKSAKNITEAYSDVEVPRKNDDKIYQSKLNPSLQVASPIDINGNIRHSFENETAKNQQQSLLYSSIQANEISETCGGLDTTTPHLHPTNNKEDISPSIEERLKEETMVISSAIIIKNNRKRKNGSLITSKESTVENTLELKKMKIV